jgi:uncharacterized surface protein with fasciclin (FAS1) repeats
MKSMIAKLMILVALVGVGIALVAMSSPKPQKDIVDTAASNADFSTLVAAVKAAGLVEALKGKGPYTVFAPTNEAFEKLEAAKPGTLATILKPENKKMLQEILLYHVVQGNVMAADVAKMKNGTQVQTLAKKKIKITLKNGVRINDANVVQTDIKCSNGVIHVIDTVLLPPR